MTSLQHNNFYCNRIKRPHERNVTSFPCGFLIKLSFFIEMSLNFCQLMSVSVHYIDVTMSVMASQITSLTIVCSSVYSGAYQRKHQSSASPAFVWGIHRWPVNSPHKGPVTRKIFPFDDVIMSSIGPLWAQQHPWLKYRFLTRAWLNGNFFCIFSCTRNSKNTTSRGNHRIMKSKRVTSWTLRRVCARTMTCGTGKNPKVYHKGVNPLLLPRTSL